MNWDRMRPWLGTLIRLALGVIWIWAASAHLGNPREFVQVVRAYDATPEWLSKAIGYGLPVLELSVGILLILGVVVRMAAAISAVVFVVFLIGLIQAAARDLQLQCGCFGGGGLTTGKTSYTLDILRDVGLLALAVYLVLWSFTRLSVEEFLSRHDYVEMPSAKRMRSEQGRRKYEALVAEKQAAARTRTRWLNGSLGVVVILVALIGVGVQAGRAKIDGTVTATNASVARGVVFGKKAAATVDIYEDFQCPHCLDFERAVGPTLDRDVRANRAQVRYHPLAFLDSASSGNRYSSRAANAALCASDASVDKFVAYHNLLFGKVAGKKVQPGEGSHGRTNGALQSYASRIGLSKADLSTFDTCVQSEQHKALVAAITDRASSRGINATPTIKVNGKSIAPTLKAWNAAIAAALDKGPAPKPSKTPPTPTPSPSPSPSGSVASTTPAKSTTPAASSSSKKS